METLCYTWPFVKLKSTERKHMANIVTMEIAYNIRIFIQLSAKQQNIYKQYGLTKIVTPNEQVPERPQINNLNTVQLPVTDNKARRQWNKNCAEKNIKKDKTLPK